MTVRVRKAALEDVDALTPLFDGYRQFYGQAPDSSKARAFLHARLRRDESVVFIAENDDGDAQGFTQLYASFSSVRAAHTWLLNDLFVAPTARRQGVAEALMAVAADFARADGAARLTLSTAITNTPAQALYERLGWQREEGFVEYALTL